MLIKAHEHTGVSTAAAEGARLAVAVVERMQWNAEQLSAELDPAFLKRVEIDATWLPPRLLISSFYTGFVQQIQARRADLVASVVDIQWKFRFPFQGELAAKIIGALVADATKRPEDDVDDLLRRWKLLTNEYRVALMALCCKHCGALDPRCTCWNDE